MSQRTRVTTTYEAERVIQPIYTGGDVALDRDGQILATCLGEEAVLTSLSTGKVLARIEGVRVPAELCEDSKLNERYRMVSSSPHCRVCYFPSGCYNGKTFG